MNEKDFCKKVQAVPFFCRKPEMKIFPKAFARAGQQSGRSAPAQRDLSF